MKRILLAFALAPLVAACGTATDGTNNNQQSSPLVGSWLSSGGDVAPLLAKAPFNYVRITAQFNDDNTYVVTGTDKDNKLTTFTGTYSDTQSDQSTIYSITVHQSQPASTTAVGIYSIDSSSGKLRYEVVQTQPTNGLQPPTAAAGFGSTVYNGMKIDTLIQNFIKQ
jgi:hypothetical protein